MKAIKTNPKQKSNYELKQGSLALDQEVETIVQLCLACHLVINYMHQEPVQVSVLPSPLPSGKYLLVIVDK